MSDGTRRENFFNTTRGRILKMLCSAPLTVSELAEELQLTGNAVRAQLAVLQREGLARQSGLHRGVRKPHFAFELTAEGRRLFPTAYEPVLAELVYVLVQRVPRGVRSRLLREVLQRLAHAHLRIRPEADARERLAELKQVVAACGPAFEIEREDHTLIVRACTCPLASVVAHYPDLCVIVADVLTDALGRPVMQRCDRGSSPRCCFEVKETPVSSRKVRRKARR
jgi:predicted ArsR family transcriptional regulator